MKKDGAYLNFIMAFWQLYESKTIEEISVRELCERAGYNRSTFYLYFGDKYDLLDKAVEELLAPGRALLESLDDFPSMLKTDRMIKLFMNLFERNNKYLELVVVKQDNIMEDKLKGVLRPLAMRNLARDSNPAKIEYMMEYHVSAIFGTYRAWLKNGKDIPKEDIVSILYGLSNDGAFSLLRHSHTTDDDAILHEDEAKVDAFLSRLKEEETTQGGGLFAISKK